MPCSSPSCSSRRETTNPYIYGISVSIKRNKIAVAGIDQNSRQTLTALSSLNDGAIVPLWADPTTHRLLVDASGASITIYSDTVSGIIDGVNVTFTVAHTIGFAITLYLANSVYQPGVDFTVSGTTITMTTAPDSSLSGQPFWLSHT